MTSIKLKKPPVNKHRSVTGMKLKINHHCILTLELSSHLLGIPLGDFILLSQVLIGC